ncbi:MFS transporter [Marinifilum caeruleilacunae]|uniref:MFS transporter n=1 Tax=Marinifilum caeruleilacunae TaxID=2499076 RepID=A0ABX1X0X2_9BACT|nr:MFS transporter [Marinifilum caeruleilacunae]NOU61959.1 MFS transporter [Marinifilum caeruleilacunae]
MAPYKTAAEDKVPFGQKAAYGAGQLTINLYPAALGVFMFYLIYGFKMDPALAGLVAALPKIFDALIDPIMGFLSDNTRSKWGRRKPYILLGTMLSGISFMILWQLYPENSQAYNFIYFLILSIVFFISFTIYSTPFIGLGYEMTPDYNERTRLMAVGQVFGQFAWMIAPWFWSLIGNPDLFFKESTEGVRVLSLWVGGVSIIIGALPALFCKELVLPESQSESKLSMKNMTSNLKEFWQAIVQTLTCKPFVKLCGATFLIFNGFQTIAQFSYFIILYYIFNGSMTEAGYWPPMYSTINAAATAFLIIPIITRISTRVGKKNAFIISTLLSIVGYVLKWWGFNPANPWLMFIPLPLISFGIGGLFTLMMSMTADVCDLDELNNGTRREGMFGAVYWLMVKIGNGLAMLVSGIVLKMVGFNQNAGTQTAESLINLRLADIIIPIIFALIAIWMMMKYSISEKRALEIRQALIARRGKVKH